jgi:peroxiredoxin
MLMALAVLLFVQTLPNSGEGLEGPPIGKRLKAFAAPSATGALSGDANVCQKAPCPKQAGARPACELVSKDVVNVCELRKRPLVLTFIFDRGADCYPQVDRTERVKDDLDGVQFATVFFSHKSPDEIRRLVEERRWTQPVAVDQDGAVANLYGVGGCPTTVFAKAGGIVAGTKLGNITEQELRTRAERLRG